MYAGAHVAPVSERPTTRRLYEFTVGEHSAVTAGACARMPPRKWYASCDRFSPRGSLLSSNRLREPLAIETCMCMPLPGRFANGFGMNEQIRPNSLAISHAAILKKMK